MFYLIVSYIVKIKGDVNNYFVKIRRFRSLFEKEGIGICNLEFVFYYFIV